jgi:hypothetical protein
VSDVGGPDALPEPGAIRKVGAIVAIGGHGIEGGIVVVPVIEIDGRGRRSEGSTWARSRPDR